MEYVVFVGYEQDCDGRSEWASRALVPAGFVVDGREDIALHYALCTEQLSSYSVDSVVMSMSHEQFMSEHHPNLDEWHQGYWLSAGYATLSEHWEPWVYDDSIGTVLDHRYDD